MKRILPLILFSTLALTGAGCISLSSSSSAPATNGGVYTTTDAGATWTAKQVYPQAGGLASIASVDVLNMLFDPSDANAIYIGTRGNGMLFSYDNGASWMQSKQSEVDSGQINGIAIDKSNKCVIYVAKGANVMKSIDCARTFDTQAFVETKGKIVEVVRSDWYNTKVVWIGTQAGDVLKSSDGGKTWSTVKRAGNQIMDLMIDNSDSRIVIVATKDDGLYRTTDGGLTWAQLTDVAKQYNTSSNGTHLTQTKDGNVQLFVNAYGLLRSADHGATWTALTLLTAPKSVTIYSAAIKPDDANTIYYGTSTTLYATTDGGSNWSTHKLPTTRFAQVLSVDPNDAKTLFMGMAAPLSK